MYYLKNKTMAQKQSQKQPFYRRKAFLWLTSIVGVILLIALAFRISPWPGAMVIRAVFNHGGGQTLQALEQKLPDYPVRVLHDEQYRPTDKDARLDVYIPEAAAPQDRLPLIIWTHGGAWLSGNKKAAAPYYARLANEGYIVISLGYSLAPNKKYPTAVHQLNDAYAHILKQAGRYQVNTEKILFAGDSAGAQLSSQMAAIITSPAYAEEMRIKPALKPAQLAGVLLFCGIYKMEGLTHPDPTLPKIVSWGDDVAVWAYTGSRGKPDPLIRQMSAYYHATNQYPATFITGGNADPLTDAQSRPFADKLRKLGVSVASLFYPKDHTPALPHEYQFTLNADGERAYAAMLEFIKQQTATQ